MKTLEDSRVEDLASVAGRYRCVMLDPPWPYRDAGIRGGTKRHYPTMSVEELAALPVGELAHADGCAFWMWTTWPFLRQGVPHLLLEEWGLTWKGEVVWDKLSLGTGHWTRSRTEVLILAVTGKIKLTSNCVDPVLQVRRRPKHSEKPKQFYDFVEELCPGPRIELFARSGREGWDRWGNEAPEVQ